MIFTRGKKIRKALKGYIAHLFPQRQIFVRSEGRVRFFTLSSPVQVALAALVLGLAGWGLYVSTVYFAYNSILEAYTRIISDKEAALERSEAAYRDLLARAMEQNLKFLSRDHRLKENNQHLLDILTRNAVLERNLVELKVELTRSEKSYTQMVAARDALNRNLREVENKLGKMVQRNAALKEEAALIQGKLDAAEKRNEEAFAEGKALRKQLTEAKDKSKQLADGNSMLSQRLNALKNELGKGAVERDEMTAQRLVLEQRLKDLKQDLANLNKIQQKLIARLTERTIGNNKEVEKTLSLTGLDVNALLEELRRNSDEDGPPAGQGGPFVAYESNLEKNASDFPPMKEIRSMLVSLAGHVERWEGLHQILRRLPLSDPVDQYQITSKFGKRRDPITGEYALHDGIDLSSIPRAPVLATAPGKVIFVGWNGNYGKMVKIDHGMGVITCYGHLQKILVNNGQQVQFHQKIGIMGNTGRSTGTHVHYEVLINGKPYDPLKLMKAGKNVFKG